jgi:hypothetical protein
MFYRSAANIRLLPAALYVGLAACDVWVVEHGNASGLFSLLVQVVAACWITRYRMRTPRGAVNWRDRHGPLPDYLQDDKVQAAVKIVPGTRASARVRGRLTSPVVLITTRTALAWNDNPRARDVQWAHESAHVGMGDAFVYYLMSSAVGLALLNQLIGDWRSPSNEFVLVAMALIALISIRAYCRTRELAADSMAGVILGDKLREELASSTILDANRIPFVRTHPSLNERLAVLKDPIAMLNGATFYYFATGFMAVSVAIALHRVLYEWNAGKASVFASLVIVSLLIGWLTSRHSAMASMTLLTRRWMTLLPMLSVGELSSFVMHGPSLVLTHRFLVIVGWSLVGSVLAALIGRVAGLAAMMISAAAGSSSNSFSRVILGLRIMTAILAAAAWIVPWFI